MTRPYFREPADEARLNRMWEQLDRRFDEVERRRPWRRGAWVLATCAAAVALFFIGVSQRATPVATHLIELSDHSRVEYSAQDWVELEEVSEQRVSVRLLQGRATFRITPNRAREFLTHAAGYTVRVLGTEYVVDMSRGDMRVSVTRGLVEVRRDQSADVWKIAAGESWTSADVAVVEEPHSELKVDAGIREDVAAPAPTRTRKKAPRAEDVDPAKLFQQAQDERIAGHPERAAELLGDFLQRFPTDPRAGLSAFELARLRLDLGDPKAALEALDRAQRAGYALVEQVEMRRVQALEESGDLRSCRKARDAFLARFPASSFGSMVRRRCP
jgi:transmembrane sensor